MVVEDNREIRHYLSQSLSENYQVYEASNGKEALAILSENEVNLILTSLVIVKAKIFNILRTHKQMIERYRHSKKIEPPKITVNSLGEEWMENALTVVKKHLSDDKFSTDIFAREMLMSRTSLYTKMKALTGESVKEFIRRIRLNTAQK